MMSSKDGIVNVASADKELKILLSTEDNQAYGIDKLPVGRKLVSARFNSRPKNQGFLK